MPLQAVTDLKITQIRRNVSTQAFNDRPNCSFSPYLSNDLSNKLNVFYTFDVEWINPNFDPHWTELTVTQSGNRNTFDVNHPSSLWYNWTIIPSYHRASSSFVTQAEADVLRQLMFGVGMTPASYSYDFLKDHQNTAFTGGNAVNKISGVYCRIYAMDGDYPQTVTITVKTKTVQSSQTTTITRVMNIGEGSVLEGPLIPTLSGAGTIQSRNLDGFFRTESDSKSLTGAMLGIGSSPSFNIVSPLYDLDGITTSAQVRAASMAQGKFYKLTNTVNYGLPVVFDYDKFITAIPSAGSNYATIYYLKQNLNSGFASVSALSNVLYYANLLYGGNMAVNARGSITSSIDLQYLVIVPPEIETTTTEVVRTGLNQAFSYRVKKATGSAEFVTNATSFALGTLPTGITATINSDGVISGTMTALGTYTVSVSASNSSGTSTGSVKVTCQAFAGVDKTITVEAGQPINEVLAASSPATYELVSSTAPTGAVSIVGGSLKGAIQINGTYSVVIRASMTGSTPVLTDDLTYTVNVAGLAQPSSLFVRNVRRVLSTDKRTLDYYGVLSWDFVEPKNHSVKVTTLDLETNESASVLLTRNSKATGQLKLGSWSADSSLDKKSFRLEVQLIGDYSSSLVGFMLYDVSLADVGQMLGKIAYDDLGGLGLPSVEFAAPATNTTNVGTIKFTPSEGTPQISSIAPPPNDWSIIRNVSNSTTTVQKTSVQLTVGQMTYGLRDGGNYTATVSYQLAGPLTVGTDSSNRKIWNTTPVIAESSVNFEYYYRGLQPPNISSSLAVNADINGTFQYRIVALGAESFSADFSNLTGFSVNTENGIIEGVFSSQGTQTIPISATNRKGTTNKSLVVTVRDFYADPQTIRAVQNRPFRQKLLSSKPATWVLTAGAPAGFTLTTDSSGNTYLAGTTTTTGSFSVGLRATQTGYTPTRFVDVNYALTVVAAGFVDPTEVPTVITVPANADAYSSGKSLFIGDKVALGFNSDPSVAKWEAEGLPPGITLNADTGLLSGAATQVGTYSALITAKAEDRAVSLPVLIGFNVENRPTSGNGTNAGTAISRVPWISERWDLIDLQVHARTRRVESSLMSEALTLKVGDDLTFAIFFLNHNGLVFDMAPSRIRLTIRPENNVDEPLIVETAEAPVAKVQDEITYYELSSKRGVDWAGEPLEIVEDWVNAQASKGTGALPCVAEVEWIKDGKSYSSEAFKVSVLLDVTR